MGEVKERLRADRVDAKKALDKLRADTLGMALAAIQIEEVAGKAARELSDAEELTVLTREVSKRKDSAEAYTAGRRPELAAKELAEAEILQAYLPARLTDADVDTMVAEEIAAVAAASGSAPTLKQLGLVIKAVNARAQGRAEGSVIAAKVRAALS